MRNTWCSSCRSLVSLPAATSTEKCDQITHTPTRTGTAELTKEFPALILRTAKARCKASVLLKAPIRFILISLWLRMGALKLTCNNGMVNLSHHLCVLSLLSIVCLTNDSLLLYLMLALCVCMSWRCDKCMAWSCHGSCPQRQSKRGRIAWWRAWHNNWYTHVPSW